MSELLLDRMGFDNLYRLARPVVRSIIDRRHDARAYVFDPQASAHVGWMLRQSLDFLVDNIEFARAPYPMTYIELDMRSLWPAWRDIPAMTTMDQRVGYIIDNGHVVIIAEGDPTPQFHSAGFGLWNFRINRPQSIPMHRILKGLGEHWAELGKLAYIFGGQRHVDPKTGNIEALVLPEINALAPLQTGEAGSWTHLQVGGHFDLGQTYRNLEDRDAFNALFMGGGDPCIVLAALLLLNQPTHRVAFEHQPQKKVFTPQGQIRTWTEHHVVTIHLDPHEKIDRILHVGQRASPILHDVEGHWKNFNKHEGCTHHWEPIGPERTISGDYKKYWCPRCLQRRTWTDATVRGDASRGVATKHYEVKE